MRRAKKAFSALSSRQSKWLVVILPSVMIGIFLFLITLDNVYSQTYQIERFNRAKETIRSPITIENESETERKTRESVQAVGDRYTITDDVTKEQVQYIEEIFDAIDSFTGEKTKSKDQDDAEDLTDQEIVMQLDDILSSDITDQVDDLVFLQLLQLGNDERDKGEKAFIKSFEKTMGEGVRIENIESAKAEVKTGIQYTTLGASIKEALYNLIDFAVVENSFFDVEKTMKARNEAASDVTPVIIRSGDILVREGQIITDEIYQELKLAGVLQQERTIFPAAGLAVFIILLCIAIGYELNRLFQRKQLNVAKAMTIVVISVLNTGLMKLIGIYTDHLNHLFLLVPAATGVLLLKLLTFERFSMIMAVVYAVIGSILFNGHIPGSLNMEALIYFLFFQFVGIFLLRDGKDRMQVIKSALGMAVSNVMIIVMFVFLSFETYEQTEMLIHFAFGIGAAVLSTVLTIGVLPFFETAFGLLSDHKLLTLANPNQPLLRKILTEAPGTYHHSVMVANLGEAACEAVGANGLLARVGAYYHDIGKTFQPHYFIENQVAIRNPHDFIQPEESAKIIISHVTEGVKLLEEHRLPKEIIDIAAQHHGTSLVGYFYQMAKNNDSEVDEAVFRYPGPKPQSKETGIISICDSVEAAVRSLKEPSPEKIDEIVLSIINNKLMDGQFDQTPLTLKELHTVRETVCEALKGIFHSRIQYPDKEATKHGN